MKMVIAA